jgi:hypothetical protein
MCVYVITLYPVTIYFFNSSGTFFLAFHGGYTDALSLLFVAISLSTCFSSQPNKWHPSVTGREMVMGL